MKDSAAAASASVIVAQNPEEASSSASPPPKTDHHHRVAVDATWLDEWIEVWSEGASNTLCASLTTGDWSFASPFRRRDHRREGEDDDDERREEEEKEETTATEQQRQQEQQQRGGERDGGPTTDAGWDRATNVGARRRFEKQAEEKEGERPTTTDDVVCDERRSVADVRSPTWAVIPPMDDVLAIETAVVDNEDVLAIQAAMDENDEEVLAIQAAIIDDDDFGPDPTSWAMVTSPSSTTTRTTTDSDDEHSSFHRVDAPEFGEEKTNESFSRHIDDEVASPPSSFANNDPRPPPVLDDDDGDDDAVPLLLLRRCHRDDFERVLRAGSVEVVRLGTYQGRRDRRGVNACAVIAPLVAARHLSRTNADRDEHELLPDAAIEEVVDVAGPAIAGAVRETDDDNDEDDGGLIVPSDAHDRLLDENHLSAEQFVDVIGGDATDPDRLKELLRRLAEGESDDDDESKERETTTTTKEEESDDKQSAEATTPTPKKTRRSGGRAAGSSLARWRDRLLRRRPKRVAAVDSAAVDETVVVVREPRRRRRTAATFFFHAHVVCVLRQPRPNGECWYEMVDSLPGDYVLDDDGADDPVVARDDRNAVRIRCRDAASLETTLRWYVFSKFSEADERFSYAHEFDDLRADEDPRVFQAFVWRES